MGRLGAILLTVGFILSLLVSISVPYISVFDMTRSTFKSAVNGSSTSISEFRLGIWGYCLRLAGSGHITCERTGVGYPFQVSAAGNTEYISANWTRGLAVQPVATAVIFIAFLLSLSNHLTVLLIASLLSFFGALVTLVSIAITIALYVRQHAKMNNFNGVQENTNFGPAFWMNIATFVVTLAAAFTVCFGRRHESRVRKADTYVPNTGYSRPAGWRRFIPGRRY